MMKDILVELQFNQQQQQQQQQLAGSIIMTTRKFQKVLMFAALIINACGSVEYPVENTPDSGLTDASTEVTDAQADAAEIEPEDPCGCTVWEDRPSPTAIYIKTCGDNVQYVEHSVGYPSEISVCVHVVDAGGH